ncbi:MAG: transketolase [Chloroflexi bacterium]|nr:MAG: transketolase [Chloroflexota bacterium]
MELRKRVHAKKLVEWAKDIPEVLVLSADLTSNTEVDLFRDAYPDRFLSMGMTEQNIVSFAGGLAREGFVPFFHTFAIFIYRRALDQISMSVAYPNLKVRLVGFLPGITTPGGATHQATDDVAILRAIPNMTIVEPGDANEVAQVLDIIEDIDGPVYIRQLRGAVPVLFNENEPMQFNRARKLKDGTDITLFSSGICTEEAMRASKILEARGVSMQHLHVSTHKPFNDPSILAAAEQPKYGVITMENHTIIGGLGSEVAEVMAENGVGKKLSRIGLQDTYAHGASRPYLMRTHGLDAMALVRKTEEMVGENLNITDADLESVRIDAVHSDAKAEAL